MSGSQTHHTLQSRQSSWVLVVSDSAAPSSAARGGHMTMWISWCARQLAPQGSPGQTSATFAADSIDYIVRLIVALLHRVAAVEALANRSGCLVGCGHTKLIGCNHMAPWQLDSGQRMNLTTEINAKDEKGSQIARFHETFLF